jgi:replication factor C subunit 3/5
MTKNAQLALKTLIQISRNNVRFCLICNYISKIEPSLLNEFMCIRFNQLPKSEIDHFILSIAQKENIDMPIEWVDTIQVTYQSDIRSMINFMQLHLIPRQTPSSLPIFRDILTRQTWDRLYEMLMDETNVTAKDILLYVHESSVKYNMDKRNMLNTFFNYIVRNHSEIITAKILDVMEQVVHATDTPIEYLLRYLVGRFRENIPLSQELSHGCISFTYSH